MLHYNVMYVGMRRLSRELGDWNGGFCSVNTFILRHRIVNISCVVEQVRGNACAVNSWE